MRPCETVTRADGPLPNPALPGVLRQRSDYTYKFNAKTGRHGWLRLTPAYSLKIVEELIQAADPAARVLDPFCGTGTTALSAASHGLSATTTDINPFLIWLARAKVADYDSGHIGNAADACAEALALVARNGVVPAVAPPIHNIERWWDAAACAFLCSLRAAISRVTAPKSPERTLLLVAFCRTLMAASNAAFNHQSMSFAKPDDAGAAPEAAARHAALHRSYIDDVAFVLAGARDNPRGRAAVVFGDARALPEHVDAGFDLVVTSPPYANRMSYIRELRPYMYWLGFLQSGRAAGELDWQAIGGTWGIATSRLGVWQRPRTGFASPDLSRALTRIVHAENKNGALLAAYVDKYCQDMWLHFQGLTPLLRPGARLHYIVGNSTFYGALVSTERLYAEMLATLGFEQVQCRAIRKRNSKKELVEFDVQAVWPG